jgi:Putative auto-transporter adhesin, head GIN domain
MGDFMLTFWQVMQHFFVASRSNKYNITQKKLIMKFYIMTTLMLLSSFFFRKTNAQTIVKGSKELGHKDYIIGEFSKVKVSVDGAEVLVTHTNNCSLLIEAEKNILNLIDVFISDSELIVQPKKDEHGNPYKFIPFKQFAIKIGFRNDIELLSNSAKSSIILEDIKVNAYLIVNNSASGSIECKNVEAYKVLLTNSGSGNITASVNCNTFVAKNTSGGVVRVVVNAKEISALASSDGDIVLEGASNILFCSTSGSGKIRASSLKSENVEIAISSSGNCEINCRNILMGNISGSGFVFYSGKPLRIEIQRTSSGKAVPN